MVKNAWMKYFYPKIYKKYVGPSSDPNSPKNIEKIDPDSIGYHPFCPPAIHVFLLNILQVLNSL